MKEAAFAAASAGRALSLSIKSAAHCAWAAAVNTNEGRRSKKRRTGADAEDEENKKEDDDDHDDRNADEDGSEGGHESGGARSGNAGGGGGEFGEPMLRYLSAGCGAVHGRISGKG